MCEARVPVLGILAFRICGFRILPSDSLALKSVCGEFECRVLPVFEIPALTIYNRRAGIHIAFMHSSPQTLEIYSIRPPGLGICQQWDPPNPGICSTFSAKRPPNPRICSLCWISSVWFEKIELVVAQNEIRTRSKRDADLHILVPTQGKTGIALKVLPKQAFKFKSERDADLHILAQLKGRQGLRWKCCQNKPLNSRIWERRHPIPRVCRIFSAIRRPSRLKSWNFTAFSVQWHPQMLEFAALLVQGGAQILEFAAPWVNFCNVWRQRGPPHRALTAENSGFPPFWGSLRRGIHIISDCGNHFRGCENLWHYCVQLRVSLLEGQMSRNTYKTRYTPKKRDWQEFR